MSNLDSLIRNNLDMPISEDVSIYKDVENRKKFTNEICEIVNTKINKTVQPYDKDILEDIRTNGYAVVENFISSDEIEELKLQYRNEWLDSLGVIPKRTRQPFSLPTLKFNPCPITGIDMEYQSIAQFEIKNYQSHPAIKAPLSN